MSTCCWRTTGSATSPTSLSVVDELLDRRLGKVKARVSSAAPLDESQSRRLREVLERKLGKDVDVEISVDPTLLGGFVAQVGSDRYDVSLRGQLNRLEASMAEDG